MSVWQELSGGADGSGVDPPQSVRLDWADWKWSVAWAHDPGIVTRRLDVPDDELRFLYLAPPKGYVIPDKLPQRGRIEVIRLIRSDRELRLFGEKIEMPEETVHQYVLATIHVRARRLVVTFKGSTVHEAPHPIR